MKGTFPATAIRFFGVILLLSQLSRPADGESSVSVATRQFTEYCLHESTDHGNRVLDDVELPKPTISEAAHLLDTLAADGSWPDIDYASHARAAWPPATHLTRALSLLLHARSNATAADECAKYSQAVHKTLLWWKQHDYQCPNWWYNQIGVPKILGNVALLLGADLTADEREFIANTVLTRSKVGAMTGQNRVWLAGNGLMRAMLLSDEKLLDHAASVIQEELKVGTGEGIQPDWSFHQHGPQQQFGNYGMGYGVDMSRWATILRGTPCAFTPEKIGILRDYLLEGQNWITWHGKMDISACGRQLSPNSPARKAAVVSGIMRVASIADPEHAPQYQAFVTRNQNPTAPNDLLGDRYFWRSDYLVHRRSDLMVTLKMSSARVIGGETVNDENLSGLHLADGATLFYRSGLEYEDIFPLWDWCMIPGVTAELSDAPLRWPTPDVANGTEFVGAVSDGTCSCAAMNIHRDGLSAKKAWFLFGDAAVCLGSDIRSTGSASVVTTVNNCLRKTDVRIARNGRVVTIAGADKPLDGVEWAEHDAMRYWPLDATQFHLSTARTTGNWKKVFDSPATPRADVSGELFKLWIDHGSAATDGQYAYAVSPVANASAASVQVISNTPNAQAVKTGSGVNQVTGIVFWDAGGLTVDGANVHVDAPCIVLMNAGRVSVADPTQKLKEIRLELAGKSAVVTLPGGGAAGKSVTLTDWR